MKFFQTAFAVLCLIVAGTAFADHSIFVEVNGTRYSCNGGGGGGGTDPACVEKLSIFCYSFTSMNRDQCYDLATQNCRNGGSQYASCIERTANYCYNNTSHNRDTCFNQALGSCRGSVEESMELLEGVKRFTELKEKGLSVMRYKQADLPKAK
jgi:hypothetical protein